MIIDNKYTIPYNVPSNFIDGNCRLTPMAMVTLAQDLAALHYGTTGLSIPHIQQNGLAWVISKQNFNFYEYPLWLDKLILKTWAEKPRGILCFRDVEYCYQQNGRYSCLDKSLKEIDSPPANIAHSENVLLQATTLWMVIDLNTNRPVKLEEVMGNLGFSEDKALEHSFSKIHLVESWAIERHFSPNLLDIDLNSHVNNLSYFQWILSFMDVDFCTGKLIKNFQSHFVSSARLGDELICRAQPLDDTTWVHSIIRSDGSEVYRAKTQWATATELSRELVVSCT